jgi:hypothetical protein
MSTASSGQPTSFQDALERYKTNYTQYRTTGNLEYKVKYQSAESYIVDYLTKLNLEISTDATRITNFLSEYANANPEMAALQSKFATIREEGPKLQDKYTTVRRAQRETPPADYTAQYVKLGLIAAAVGLVVAFSR